MRKLLLVVGVAALAACSDTPTSPSQLNPKSLTPAAALAAGNTVQVVTESDVTRQAENTPPTNNWVLYTRALGLGDFVVGPAAPPLGVGSFRTQTPATGDKVFLFNYDHVGTVLADITGISYSTYKTATATSPAFPALNVQIDIDGGALGAGEFRTFVWEPYQQPGFVNSTGVWESRDAYNGGAGKWWSTTGGAAGVATGGARGCGQGSPCTWTDLLAAFPGASIVGGFGINQGSGNPGIDGSTDALSIAYGGNSVTYDFEPYAVATTKDSCKDGGWETVKRADGSSFKNQGDCVSYVNNGK